jgi:thiamine pyrophosphokinase
MDARPRTAIVITGGGPIVASLRPVMAGLLPARSEDGIVVAADSGLDRARELGLEVDIVVGDLDSVEPASAETAAGRGVEIETHPREKDAIDLELAIDAARRSGAGRIVVVDGGGGRLDMAMANLLLLAAPAYAGVALEAVVGGAVVHVVRDGGRLTVAGSPGDRLSLLPVHGAARGVVTERLRYPLDHEDLPPGTSRGCSNEMLADTAGVALEEGTLLCILPGRD